jgi:hypothetical protein
MEPDKNSASGSYGIYNIYYDTSRDDIIRQSLGKPDFKEKLRLRSYTPYVKDGEKVYLEIKRKINGAVIKRRASMTIEQAELFISAGIIPDTKGYMNKQIVNEIAYLLSRYELSPKVYIAYDRAAYTGEDDLRITFDKDIRTRRENVDLRAGDSGRLLLNREERLMEIKHSGAIPLWLTRTLSELKIYKKSFSKYGNEYIRYTAENPRMLIVNEIERQTNLELRRVLC